MDAITIILLSCTVTLQVSLSIAMPGTTDSSTTCGNLTCSQHAKCRNETGPYICKCRPGFKGETCDEDRDECTQGNPCYHRGICHNTIGSWWCECLDGWKGTEHCEENITEVRDCMPGWVGDWCDAECYDNSDCGVNAYCHVLHNGGHRCLCNRGWGGKDRRTCTEDRDECERNNLCRHSGSCINTQGSYFCACVYGWTGTYCEMDVNECASQPCENNGYCTNNAGSFSCQCATGWLGQTCSEFDECVSSPCTHFGKCENTPGSYTCACPMGLVGQICQDKDVCLLEHPCSNSANCSMTNHTYHCRCADGWQGVNCTDDIDECAIQTCVHADSCSNTIGSYICYCSCGWQGDDCNDDVNECDSNPCNGTCQNTQGSYVCTQRPQASESSQADVGIIFGTSTVVILLILVVLLVLYKYKWKRHPINRVNDLTDGSEVNNEDIPTQSNKQSA